MRKLALFFLLVTGLASAQTPRVETFGGYSLLHEPGRNFNGWNGAGTLNVYRCLGVTADFAGYYQSDSFNAGAISVTNRTRIHSYTFGPAVAYRNSTRFTPFGRFLIGGSHYTFSSDLSGAHFSGSTDQFTVIIGGGFDIAVGKSFALRPLQLDYRTIHFPTVWLRGVRYSAGIVFRFGERK